MNVAITTKHQKSIFITLFQRWFFKKSPAQAMFWTSFPILLLLLNLGVSWFKPTPLSLDLPFFALIAVPLVQRYRVLGISISYAAIGLMIFWTIPTIEPDERLWQMGIFFNLALTLYIILLTVEEVECCLEADQDKIASQHQITSQMAIELQMLKNKADEREKELEEEIEKLKSEAELRRIEKGGLQKHMDLIQSEIELLNSQKEAFILDSKESRQAAINAELQLQNWKVQAEEAIQQSNAHILVCEERQKHWDQHFEIAQAKQSALEEVNNYLREELIIAQQAILLLQQKMPIIIEKEIISPSADSNQMEMLQKAVNKAQGLYDQLQSQFQVKSEILAQTRRELFTAQGAIEIFERAGLDAASFPQSELTLERMISSLTSEMEGLQEEINYLESIISNLSEKPLAKVDATYPV